MSQNKDHGGFAFPSDSAIAGVSCGMYLRDYFAAKALSGILQRVAVNEYNTNKDYAWAAREAYLAADAMLEVRNKGL